MSGVNKAIIIGNVGQEPEVRYTQLGSAVCNLPVATSESWKDKNTGDKKENTEWHRLVFFGKLAEIVNEYVRKGSKIYAEGRLQTKKWQDQSGTDRYTTEIVCSEMQMLDSKSSSSEQQQSQGSQQEQSQGGGDPFDDDIPFAPVPFY